MHDLNLSPYMKQDCHWIISNQKVRGLGFLSLESYSEHNQSGPILQQFLEVDGPAGHPADFFLFLILLFLIAVACVDVVDAAGQGHSLTLMFMFQCDERLQQKTNININLLHAMLNDVVSMFTMPRVNLGSVQPFFFSSIVLLLKIDPKLTITFILRMSSSDENSTPRSNRIPDLTSKTCILKAKHK